MATVRIPTPLRKLTAGQEEVKAAGSTITAVIGSLESQFPGLKERICDDSGQVRRFVNIFVNDEDIRYLGKDATPAADAAQAPLPASSASPTASSQRDTEAAWRFWRAASSARVSTSVP